VIAPYQNNPIHLFSLKQQQRHAPIESTAMIKDDLLAGMVKRFPLYIVEY
jgi:hypothetical protein